MPYLYETHMHTSQASACGVSRGREYISRYKDLGYTGIIITDHFFGGNSAVDRSLPWKRRIELFCRGWEDAREEGARKGLDVFFGWEQTYDGDDYLIYGLDKAWLMEHPESASWSRKQQFEGVGRAGGCVVQAHPFRQHFYIRRVTLASALVHGVEAANGGNSEQSYDALAWAYAKKLGLPVTAGSDIHEACDVREGNVLGVWLDKKMETIADYVVAVKGNNIARLNICPGRCDLRGNEDTIIPVEILDAQEKVIARDIRKFLNL
ncbi:PHP-associated domain-containing protein [Leadbettera azotonutricia]|uniref:Putative PHP domain protein n=1 Tax=Leadbettera azotonutricia (strain ATCC BAA-888 / DSM 13862 / ZAS-9) TaxID=545695 RepID=F5YF56_LEAAZ|nr:PHP domain-containing protein [Leadbettera azotonutricia]AEF82831.1 putative PHP domain protein [Leadbettera azotonutricia ZAS-9]